MNIYHVTSHKGGVGVTTTACSLAGSLARQGHKTLIVDGAPHKDCYSWLGLPSDTLLSPVEASSHYPLWVTTRWEIPNDEYDFIVADGGVGRAPLSASAHTICVVRNDYMTLRNTVPHTSKYDTFVMLEIAGGVLNSNDISAVLSRKVHVVKMDESAQRAIDAGMALMRQNTVFGWADELAKVEA